MPISPAQKLAIEEVIKSIITATAPRGKRYLSSMFMNLVDRIEWPQYYEIIPEPRCIKNIQAGVDKNRYKECADVYTDLSLVFWNALFYNESDSQIAMDAATLKALLETEWKKRTVLPITRSSPPPSSAQKVHEVVASTSAQQNNPKPIKNKTATPAPPTPAPLTPATLPNLLPRTATPVAQPAASTSNAHYNYVKPVSIRPKAAQRPDTPDVDVDIMSSDEQDDEAGAFHAERDPQSEEIVKQLEKGLPRWPGFSEEGWMHDMGLDRLTDIVHTIKSFKDIIGNRLAVSLESVPEESSPTLHLSSTAPVSLKQIETRTRHKMYTNAQDFDKDMARLFEKARRWHDPGTESYGRILILQRLYQVLTSANPPPGPPYVSSTNFASLRAGPGNVKPVHGPEAEGVANVTTHRVLSKDRRFVDEVNYKGWKIKLADWVHLSNPDDASRPIIGQVFRCWESEEVGKKGTSGITVSWYYRPEQTFHPATRQFWEGEVFKTSHFADHPVEDIIEKVACQFTARHIRGRPRPPFWYVGFPLYVCDSRYNDRDRVFVRIKNWNSCVPEEVRQSTEFMPIYPFERTVYPIKLPSPFLVKGSGKGAAKGPGGTIDASPEQTGTEAENVRKRGGVTASGPGQARPAPVNMSVGAPASYQHYIPPQALYPQQQPHPPQQSNQQRLPGPDRSVVSAAGGLMAIGGSAQVEKLPPESAKLFDRDPETNEVLWFAAPPINMPRARGPRYSMDYLHFLAKKRKLQHREADGVQVDGGEVNDEGGPAKRPRSSAAPPTVTETIRQVINDMMKELGVDD